MLLGSGIDDLAGNSIPANGEYRGIAATRVMKGGIEQDDARRQTAKDDVKTAQDASKTAPKRTKRTPGRPKKPPRVLCLLFFVRRWHPKSIAYYSLVQNGEKDLSVTLLLSIRYLNISC